MFDSPMSVSAYEVLRVDVDIDDEGLRRAYRVRLRETHPDTGGDAALFVQVQRAWELVGTPEARAAYDRGRGHASAEWGGGATASPPPRPDTRPRARAYGQPGGWRRERYLSLIREWVGRGVEVADPYDPALVRSAPPEIRHILADALAEEETARLVADLGMGYTVWHDVFADRDGLDPEQKIDHLVLGPSGLYAMLSEDFGGPVGVRRGEITGPNVIGSPVTQLVSRARVIARAAGVRFSGAMVVLPDDAILDAVTDLGKVRGTPVVLVQRSALTTLLRRGIPGAREVGGTELFDVRTRLQQRVRHV
ncbi:MAG: molecular chaperone DnaJ [Microbacterium sp. 71-36]|uniref:J domain-containing protein n=1 Tax=unclassified Microbacterium TaxID=2609290 RepID=UPI00086DA7C3|nr:MULTISPECIES: DnaJ domain-containing protein [unclassified Microbacterium]MBN9213163.1 DnaJ domain-containing protein [Microbacterium sp.]ODT40293.1 MAG: molecular chaperone DnaJ [Microbacterium sp. SCN 71-17]ODU50693.1 MAG: molecular chaperone DnaJ [Microbacterium sp. SCN 70-10]OJV78455.1 MAG: molecular chaperone DnaJ [Microbacterium sp. 71-36]